MSKLILTGSTGSEQKETEITLHPGSLTIGRGKENDITIDTRSISTLHATIYTEKNDSFVHDHGSTNGTFVNGERIRNHALEDSDLIKIGKITLRYVEGSDAIPQTSQKREAALKIITGKNSGKEIALENDITSISASGQQVAEIFQKEGKFFFSNLDKEPQNLQSLINNHPTPIEPFELHDQDRLTVSSTILEFSLR